MRILLVVQDFWPGIGGAEKSAMMLARYYKKCGDEVIVMAFRERSFKRSEVYDGIRINRVRYPVYHKNPKYFFKFGLDFISSLFNLIKVSIRFRPDVIYIQPLCENAMMMSLLSYIYLHKSRIIISPTGQHDTFLCKNNCLYRLLFQRLLNKADKIIFSSKAFYIQAKSTTSYYLEDNKVEIIPCGIDLQDFDSKIDKFTLPNKKPYIFSCGRIVYDKGFDVLIKAFNLIHKRYPEIDLVIVGDGDERKNLESLVNMLRLTGHVHFIGLVSPEEVARYYLGCLFFVISTRHEAFGIVILEAMAARKAVVASNVGGIPSLIKDGFNGYLFESENCEALAEKMRFFAENKEKCDLLGLNGRQVVEQYYTLDKVYQKQLL